MAVTSSIAKSFVSVKGVYLEVEVPVDLKSGSGGEEGNDGTVRWVIPHSFTQYIPTDVDLRVMLTATASVGGRSAAPGGGKKARLVLAVDLKTSCGLDRFFTILFEVCLFGPAF